jgi:hypothetical protein
MGMTDKADRVWMYQLNPAKCGFRPKSITDSGRSRSAIPVHVDHRFRSKSFTPTTERVIG